jgi:PleD family two-component response regulator
MGFKVFKASNGSEALEVMKTNLPDMLITDLVMPVMDGLELIKRVKEDSITSLMPIIVITAMGDRQNVLQAAELGVDEFIIKPFDRMILGARIKSMFNTMKLQQELTAHRVESEKVKLLSEIVMTVLHHIRSTTHPLSIVAKRYQKSPTPANAELLYQTVIDSVQKINATVNSIQTLEETGLIKIKRYYEGIAMLDIDKEITKCLASYVAH